MQIRTIAEVPEISSFRIHQTIEMSYRDRPELDSTTVLRVDATREPPAILSETRTGDSSSSTVLLANDQMWVLAEDGWTLTELENVPQDWTRTAYRELGTMPLVTPLDMQTVYDVSRDVGREVVNGIETQHVAASSEVMVQLLTHHHAQSQTRSGASDASDGTPPDEYLNRYEAELWVADDGLVHRERTIMEYTEERLHGQALGTGPVTFTTTREFFDFNAEIDIPTPWLQ